MTAMTAATADDLQRDRDRAPLCKPARSDSVWERRIAVMATFHYIAHYREMPRTMLRYAVERFPEPLRRAYLRGDVP